MHKSSNMEGRIRDFKDKGYWYFESKWYSLVGRRANTWRCFSLMLIRWGMRPVFCFVFLWREVMDVKMEENTQSKPTRVLSICHSQK